LDFLPNVGCGSSGSGAGLGFTVPNPVSTGGPCALPIGVIAVVLGAVSGDNSNTKQNTNTQCDPRTLPGAGFFDFCADHGWTAVAGFDCSGDNACCADALSNFKTACRARNDAYDKKAGVERYVPIDRSSAESYDAVCCKKW
jgi:hypothetical protein